ncbi:succinoglycan biosynthesis protein exop [Mesorhizobium sp. CGMCC 1.15528]|uniref:Succinoglycan biosynthesis protein exop n=1 Tax=Mesorhizobium zhangyense TaxID=1776730 RepID=A0A7C9R5G8_9HYPH|nr:GumC family protein [Mesorhizobium zhangyense]NGN40316.1 succinoglycan biosynthesis protein exop [Mesorhizobium zhangyense]
MFDTENRDDRKRSLLAYAGDDRDARKAPRPGSLLSMANSEPEADPVERHRAARAQRESRREAPITAEAPSAQPAETSTEARSSWHIADLVPGWMSRMAQHRQHQLSSVSAEAASVDQDRRLATRRQDDDSVRGNEDQFAQRGDDGDDQQWKPLVDPMKVIGGVARSKLLIAATTILGALLGIAIALSTPKTYEAATELLIDPRDLKLVDRDLTQAGFSNEATLAIVENQVRVITSGTVLNKVVDRLNLESDPEFNGQGGGGPLSFVRSLLSRGSNGADDPGRRRSLAVGNLAKALSVERGGKTFVVVIDVKTQDGEKSALIANTMADVFLKTYGELQSDTAGRATDELTARLDELRSGVEAAERKVEAFKAENDLINAQGRLISDDEILKLNEQLSIARARTLELNAKAASTRGVNVDSVLGGVLPEEIASASMTELRSQYSTLKGEADRLAVKLGPRHPQRQAVEGQLAGARDQIAAELRRIVSSVQTELKRAVQLEQELSSRLAQLKVRSGSVSSELVTLRELEREATAKRAVYESFLLRARETGEQRDINTANMSVISVAYAPLQANGPSRSTITIASTILGFLAGIGLGGMRGAYESLRDTADDRRRRRNPRKRDAAPLDVPPGNREPAQHPYQPAPQAAPSPFAEPAFAREPAAPASAYSVAERAVSQPAPMPQQPSYPETDPRQNPAAGYPTYHAPQPVQAPVTYQQAAVPPFVQPTPQPQAYPQQPAPHVGHYGQPPVQPMTYAPQTTPYPQAPAQMYQPLHSQIQPQGYYPYPQQAPAFEQQMPVQPQPVAPPAYQPMMPGAFQPASAPQPHAPAGQQMPDPAAHQPPIEEIRASLRDFRQAVEELATSRARRRYF